MYYTIVEMVMHHSSIFEHSTLIVYILDLAMLLSYPSHHSWRGTPNMLLLIVKQHRTSMIGTNRATLDRMVITRDMTHMSQWYHIDGPRLQVRVVVLVVQHCL
jgi:hypothetical protein